MDPRLREVVRGLEPTGEAIELLDRDWRLAWVSEPLRAIMGDLDDVSLGIGVNWFQNQAKPPWRTVVTEESYVRAVAHIAPWAGPLLPGGFDELRVLANGALDPLLDEIRPVPPPPSWKVELDFLQGDLPPLPIVNHGVRLYDHEGDFIGCILLYGAGLPAPLLTLVARGDERMYERMARIREPARRAVAVMFADLGSSGALSRRLPTSEYFRLIRDITSMIDSVVVERDGIVGRHVGDGVTAFFLSEDHGSDSAAARASIEVARRLAAAAEHVAADMSADGIPIDPRDCRLNVGLHWGGGLFMGQIVTGGRLEVTALGDEVNECARIEGCARDGQILASKILVERLTADDATALGIEPHRLAYVSLGDLPNADDKARRDAGGVAVTHLGG